jgi:hypothetical protein
MPYFKSLQLCYNVPAHRYAGRGSESFAGRRGVAAAPPKHAKQRFQGARPAPYPDLTWPLEVRRALLQP